MAKAAPQSVHSPDRAEAAAWHAIPIGHVLARLHTTDEGLAASKAARRLERIGPNAVPAAPAASASRILFAQFRSVVVLLLVAAVVIAAVSAEVADAVAIAAVLALNVILGFAVEMRARRAVEALGRLEARTATVVRDGLPREVDARDLVPGDIILLEPGQAVPADARLLSGVELRAVEALLTGESVPISKRPDASIDKDAPLPERRNMLYAGTTVAAGTGRAVVVETGPTTELGLIGRLVSATAEEKTPLERRLDVLGRQLVWLALLVGAVTAVFAAFQGVPAASMLQAAIALAVAAVPEGLPAVATITLALGVRRMARRHALVRRLPSVEALGSVTVICTDKTGTLTAGAMTVTAIYAGGSMFDVTGDGYEPRGVFLSAGTQIDPRDHADLMLALQIGALANRADAVRAAAGWAPRGDPTEAALVMAAHKAGLERADMLGGLPEVGEVPFSSERKLMATFHRPASGTLTAYVKGAPQRVMELCAHIRVSGTDWSFDSAFRETVMAANQDLAARGLRVLAVARGHVTRPEESAARGSLPDRERIRT